MKIVDSNYGSDQTGLICGYLFSPGGTGWSIGSQEAEVWLANQQTDDKQFIWPHFNSTNTASEKWLRAHLGLVINDITALVERLKLLQEEIAALINGRTTTACLC
ncbi:MAG TPA: hypothetical protein VFW00_00230 [Rhodocyclaceae bacterium]|nr:hypothetical protein [Rhodocyclaceae bacterium]